MPVRNPSPMPSYTPSLSTHRTRLLAFAACLILPPAAAAVAQQAGAQTGAPIPANATPLTGQATSGALVLSGSVLDPDSAEIPGATVTLTPSSGKAYNVTSGADGTYAVRGVPPGTYSLTITMPGFASFVRQGVRITETALVINAKLAIQDQTVINVQADANTVSVDQDNNASSTVLKGKDLDALSDDPDELSSELTALAGPAAGPNGGQIYIDGFTGGQLPPKSSIREIRINQNPFSAQYDRPGFGRVEVFTKHGTDKFHGSAQLNGADNGLNSGSPLAGTTAQPGYHSIFGFGSVTGPINKSASFTLNGSYREIQDNAIIDPPSIYATSASATAPCAPGPQPGCAIYNQTTAGSGYASAIFVPATRFDISPRIDLALGEKNTLTTRFQYEHNRAQNQGIGADSLLSNGFSDGSAETTLQVSDTQIFSSKIINETRFEYQRPTSFQNPNSTAASLNVQGAFLGGGVASQTSTDSQNHIELQNYTSVALTKHFIRLGGRLRSTGETNTTTANSNGSFTYTSIANYAAGNLSTFNTTIIPVPTISVRNTDLGLYAEDDWKIRPNLTFSLGVRYETENFIHDHHDFAPRTSVAYGIGKKTVLRAGAGFFYDRFGQGSQLGVTRNNGLNEQSFIVSSGSGTTFLSPACNPSNIAACTSLTSSASRLTVENIAPNLTSPYQVQENLGVDQQLFRGATLSVNYQHIRGTHQFNSDFPNYNTASTTNPLLWQFQSNGVFNQNQLILNTNYRGAHGSLFGYYVLNFAKSDTGGIYTFASIPNNLAADYGRATFDVRSRVFLGGSFTFPYLITMSPFLVAASGSPYNITSGLDPFNTNTYNQRAVAYVAGATPLTGDATHIVKSIAGCGTFASYGTNGNTTQVPINDCTGPANFTLNLRVVKTFGFGGSRIAASSGGSGNGPSPGGGGPRPGGGGGGGGGARGGGGGFGGGGASSGQRYNFSIGAQAQNVFNIVDRASPGSSGGGVLTSPTFGLSTQLAGNIYTTNSAVRRIQLQASFTF